MAGLGGTPMGKGWMEPEEEKAEADSRDLKLCQGLGEGTAEKRTLLLSNWNCTQLTDLLPCPS